MKIVVSQSGGFAGITRTWSVEVSRTEAEERWLPLLEEARGTNDDDAQRDRYVYQISVGYQEITVTESAVTGPWKELIERAKGEADTDRTEDPDC